MLPDTPEGRLRCFRNALRNWRVHGYVRFKKTAEDWLAIELPDLSLMEIARHLYQHVEAGGSIDEKVERRPEYVSYEYHYDLRLRIGGRHLYFESLLFCEDADDPDDPQIQVVSVHDV